MPGAVFLCAWYNESVRIDINVPPEFTVLAPGLPDMRLPGEGNPEDDLWQAVAHVHQVQVLLEVRWVPEQHLYVCRSVFNGDTDNPRDQAAIQYPHEIIMWLGGWFKQIRKLKNSRL